MKRRISLDQLPLFGAGPQATSDPRPLKPNEAPICICPKCGAAMTPMRYSDYRGFRWITYEGCPDRNHGGEQWSPDKCSFSHDQMYPIGQFPAETWTRFVYQGWRRP